jgi:hypothetical protein
VKKGNKPDFHQSASGDKARTLYQAFFKKVEGLYESDRVKDGLFAAMMDVALVNDGPVGLDYACLDGEAQLQHYIFNAYLVWLPQLIAVHRLLFRSIPIHPRWKTRLHLSRRTRAHRSHK